jgi:hypothetical protein
MTGDEAPSAASPPRRRPLKLKMDIPIITLDDADRKELRDALVAILGGQNPRSTPAMPGIDPVPATVGSDGDGDPIMDTHRRTIEQILQAHEQVLTAALNGCEVGVSTATDT